MNSKAYSFPKENKQPWFWVGPIVLIIFLFFYKKPNAAPNPEPVNDIATPSTNDQNDPVWISLQKNIEEITSHYKGNVGIFIKDLKTGKTYERNADDQFITASLIKLPILAATFNAIEQNKFSLDTPFTLHSWDKRDGSGRLQYFSSGRKFRAAEIMYRMITESDNTATALLIDKLGYDYLNQNFLEYGFVTTKIKPTGMRLDDKLNPLLDNHTTPREMGMLLEKVYSHQVASYGHCDLMMDWMKHAEGHSRLSRFLPKTWSLARKGGLLRKNCHDVGIVFTPKTDYVICVLTGNNRDYKHAIGLIAAVGQTAYSHFSGS